MEAFIQRTTAPLLLTRDAADYYTNNPIPILGRERTTFVISMAQLQKIATKAGTTQAITFDIDFLKLVEWLQDFTRHYPIRIIVKHLLQVFVATGGRVSTTRLHSEMDIWRLQTAAVAAVFSMQHPTRPFEALTTAVAELNKK